MTDNVVKLNSQQKTPEELLEECKEVFKDFIILGYTDEDLFSAAVTRGLADAGDIMWLMELLKFNLMTGTYSDA